MVATVRLKTADSGQNACSDRVSHVDLAGRTNERIFRRLRTCFEIRTTALRSRRMRSVLRQIDSPRRPVVRQFAVNQCISRHVLRIAGHSSRPSRVAEERGEGRDSDTEIRRTTFDELVVLCQVLVYGLQMLRLMEAEGRKPSGRLALAYNRTACAVPLKPQTKP
jgi:hypothetical protein